VCSDGLKFKLEIKSEFCLKTKFRKIHILELVSVKIKTRDSKRKVVRIHFGHPPKKNGLGWSSPWKAAIVGLELHEWSW
jgi:hypothetical protein